MIVPEYLRCEYLINPLGIDALNPRLSWIVKSEDRGQKQTAYQIIVASREDLLNKEEGDLWDTGKISSDQTCHIIYGGKALSSQIYCYWKVKVWDKDDKPSDYSEPSFWSMGLLNPSDWKASWIGLPPKKKKRTIRQVVPKLRYKPAPLLRKEFRIKKEIRRAIIYITALGHYELFINGNRVGDHILAPEWTDYNQKIQYQTYDVSDLIIEGENAIGAILADGWYKGRLGPFGMLHDYYGTNLRLLMEMHIEFIDSTTELICTDSNWKVFKDGPIQQSDHFHGETYNTKKEQIGWDCPGFDDSKWNDVSIDESIQAMLVAQMNEPIRIIKELNPIEITEPKPGVFIYNMGQNIAGWCKVLLGSSICDPNAVINLRHAEILNTDGTLYTKNLRLTRAMDQYILNSNEKREFQPHFIYHGFQYVEITGLKKGVKPSLDILKGCVIASDSPQVGKFESSDSTLNKLYSNIIWTQIDNMISVPTDCPQRNERMGWMGDNTAYGQTAIYNMDMGAFYSKWIKDIRDAQSKDGSYPDFVPYPRSWIYDKILHFYCCPGWADCGVILPWTMYLNYGDTRIIEEHYESAKMFIEYVHKNNPELIWVNGIGNMYGDWLNGDEFKLENYPKTGSRIPDDVYSTVYFAVSTKLVSKMAEILGKNEEHEYYKSLAMKIKKKFIQEYISDEGIVKGDNQAAYAFALYYDLVPDNLRPKLIKNLVRAIETLDYRISTGFMTTLPLMITLARTDHLDVAYKLLFSRKVPSWFYMIDQGATTMWERWDAYVKGRGPQTSMMNSFNHFAIGSVGEWIYRIILGINLKENNPGYKHIIIHPHPKGPLNWVKGSYDSIHGKIEIEWQKLDDSFEFKISIPANTSTTVYLPTTDKDTIKESGIVIKELDSIEFIKVENETTIIKINSGTYNFKF